MFFHLYPEIYTPFSSLGKNVGLKMVYDFLGIDEKTQKNLLTFDKNIRTVYSNISAVYPNKNHVTTHPAKMHVHE